MQPASGFIFLAFLPLLAEGRLPSTSRIKPNLKPPARLAVFFWVLFGCLLAEQALIIDPWLMAFLSRS
jgi:hypothetical protein